MRTIFELGFRQSSWSPGLGLTAEELIAEGLKEAPGAFKSYEDVQKAKQQKETAQAQAEAAKAQAAAAQATASAQIATSQAGKILGVPTSYWVIGGLGLAAIAITVALTKK